jgi:hypothetical protein
VSSRLGLYRSLNRQLTYRLLKARWRVREKYPACASGKGREGGPEQRNAEPMHQAPQGILLQPCYAASFLTGLLAVLLFSFLAFSFAANSCLILLAMASVSTL